MNGGRIHSVMNGIRLILVCVSLLLSIMTARGGIYAGPHVFADGQLEYSSFDGGYFNADGSPCYYITDWQGNNAAVVDSEGTKIQSAAYYPYGEPTVEPKGQRFLFGGKEREHAGGRNAYDFGARSLTPYGSWPSPDPLAETFYSTSPFSYCAGDPINRIDPMGMDWVENANGDITWRKDVNMYNYTSVLSENEIYRGIFYTRDKIWLDVNVHGNSESGLMSETYHSTGNMSYKNNTPWIDVAVEEMKKGISETGDNSEILKYFDYTQLKGSQAAMTDKTPWCAAFVNYCLEVSGVGGTNNATAYSFKSWGVSSFNPQFGVIAIMNYSHVGFVIGQNKDGRIVILGGNQNNAINLSPNAMNNVLKYVYPANLYKSNVPFPKFELKKRSMNMNSTR